jgi:hypothetical protein
MQRLELACIYILAHAACAILEDMNGDSSFITVYRSADMNGEQDATAIRNLLMRNSLDAQIADDKVPGVVSGSWEVRVPPEQAPQAEALIAQVDQDDPGRADPSRELDMVTLRRTMGATGELEALGIKGILDSNGISSVIVGNTTLPNLSFFVNVSKSDFEAAQAAIAEAEAAGPAAAVEAERESEGGAPQI